MLRHKLSRREIGFLSVGAGSIKATVPTWFDAGKMEALAFLMHLRHVQCP